MPLKIVRNDIAKVVADAIVCPTNHKMLPNGGADAAIYRAAGHELWQARKVLGGCEVGEAKATPGFNLPCRYVIHTVGPQWQGGNSGEEAALRACYRACLEKAAALLCETLAIPLIASGTYGYPKDRVLKLAIREISDFLFEHEMTVYLVVFDKTAYQFSRKLFADITSYIDDNYEQTQLRNEPDARRVYSQSRESDFDGMLQLFRLKEECTEEAIRDDGGAEEIRQRPMTPPSAPRPLAKPTPSMSLDAFLKEHEDAFPVALSKLIDRKGMSDAACYKKSNVSKKTFWKIMNQKDYRPSKNTVLCFAIGLELTLPETLDLLKTVGFTLSHSEPFDLIIEYFIQKGNYDIFEINEALFEFDQPCLGNVAV